MDNGSRRLCDPHDFLHVCVCPYVHQLFTVVDDIPQFSVTASSVLTLLAVVVESLQDCDWSTLTLCDPVPLLLLASRIVNATRWSSEFSCVIRAQAISLLNGLVQLLAKHAHHVPCKLFAFHVCLIFSA